jgi:hypothetical protein
VVVSSAVPPHNAELLAALACGLRVLKRDAYLAQVGLPFPRAPRLPPLRHATPKRRSKELSVRATAGEVPPEQWDLELGVCIPAQP